MVASSKDALIVVSVLGIAYLAYRGIGGFIKGLNPINQLPSINISNPFTLSNPITSTYPNASNNDAAFLETLKGGFAAQNKTLEDFTKSLIANLTPLGTAGNPANAPTAPTPTDIILNDKTLTDEQKRKALEIISPTVFSNLGDFNPPNVFGYGILGENKKGISLDVAKALNLPSTLDKYTAQQIKLLSNLDPSENILKIQLGQAGVGALSNFFNAFGIPFKTDNVTGTQKSNMIVQNEQTAQQKGLTVQPAAGQYGGQVYTQPSNQFGGFSGGKISPNPVDTLSEVLSIFPNLSASKASDILRDIKRQNPLGLAPETVKILYPNGIFRNITQAPNDPPQIFNQSSVGIAQPSSILFKTLYPNIVSRF